MVGETICRTLSAQRRVLHKFPQLRVGFNQLPVNSVNKCRYLQKLSTMCTNDTTFTNWPNTELQIGRSSQPPSKSLLTSWMMNWKSTTVTVVVYLYSTLRYRVYVCNFAQWWPTDEMLLLPCVCCVCDFWKKFEMDMVTIWWEKVGGNFSEVRPLFRVFWMKRCVMKLTEGGILKTENRVSRWGEDFCSTNFAGARSGRDSAPGRVLFPCKTEYRRDLVETLCRGASSIVKFFVGEQVWFSAKKNILLAAHLDCLENLSRPPFTSSSCFPMCVALWIPEMVHINTY